MAFIPKTTPLRLCRMLLNTIRFNGQLEVYHATYNKDYVDLGDLQKLGYIKRVQGKRIGMYEVEECWEVTKPCVVKIGDDVLENVGDRTTWFLADYS